MAAPYGNQNAVGNKGPPKRIYTPERLKKEADALREWMKTPDNLFLEDFCWERGYHPKRISEFVRDNVEMSLAVDEFKHRQRSKLLKGGLFKAMDSGFTQYTMARVCDPIWKKSWDQPEEKSDQLVNVIINKIEQ